MHECFKPNFNLSPNPEGVRPISTRQTGFSGAMDLMNLDGPGGEETWTRTPTCKKPQSDDAVRRALQLSPPPVVGPQSDARHEGLSNGVVGCFAMWSSHAIKGIEGY